MITFRPGFSRSASSTSWRPFMPGRPRSVSRMSMPASCCSRASASAPSAASSASKAQLLHHVHRGHADQRDILHHQHLAAALAGAACRQTRPAARWRRARCRQRRCAASAPVRPCDRAWTAATHRRPACRYGRWRSGYSRRCRARGCPGCISCARRVNSRVEMAPGITTSVKIRSRRLLSSSASALSAFSARATR